MKYILTPEKTITPFKLYSEIVSALGGKEIDFTLIDSQRTETGKDSEGRELVTYRGFEFDLDGDITAEDAQIINSIIEAHIPEAPKSEVVKLTAEMLDSILQRLDTIEGALRK